MAAPTLHLLRYAKVHNDGHYYRHEQTDVVLLSAINHSRPGSIPWDSETVPKSTWTMGSWAFHPDSSAERPPTSGWQLYMPLQYRQSSTVLRKGFFNNPKTAAAPTPKGSESAMRIQYL